MAVYKVPQDVEAEDKLLGPFTFRQFIYLIVVALLGFFAFALWQLLPILAAIPVPIMLFFAVLALPLRKDQPMETYLAAVISFYIKPRTRLWDPDGVETRVEITAPKVAEASLIKDISSDEAERRFDYLAKIVDSRGWATRSMDTINTTNSLNPDIYYDVQNSVDILDEDNSIGQNIDQRLEQSSAVYKQNIINNLTHPTENIAPTQNSPEASQAYQASVQAQPNYQQQIYPEPEQATYQHETLNTPFIPTPAEQKPVGNIVINPYPSMNQAAIQPPSEISAEEVKTIEEDKKTEENTIPAGIIELATNAPEDFSIATLANQAKRISEEKKNLDENEVIISLR